MPLGPRLRGYVVRLGSSTDSDPAHHERYGMGHGGRGEGLGAAWDVFSGSGQCVQFFAQCVQFPAQCVHFGGQCVQFFGDCVQFSPTCVQSWEARVPLTVPALRQAQDRLWRAQDRLTADAGMTGSQGRWVLGVRLVVRRQGRILDVNRSPVACSQGDGVGQSGWIDRTPVGHG